MGNFSTALSNATLDHIFKNTALSQYTNIYLALSTADPGNTGGTIAEPSGNSYARVQCNTWDVAASRATQNTNAATFPTASGSWGTCTHFAGFSASSGGTFLFHGSLTTSKTITNGDTPSFAAGAVDISFAA